MKGEFRASRSGDLSLGCAGFFVSSRTNYKARSLTNRDLSQSGALAMHFVFRVAHNYKRVSINSKEVLYA
jgi:hypothetical protein